MTNFEYLMYTLGQGWRNVGYAFDAWKLLMMNDTSAYDVFDRTNFPYTEEEKVEATRFDFWEALKDDIYEKEFMEHLQALLEEYEAGNVKTTSYNLDAIDKLEELVGDVEVNLNESLNEEDD